MYLNKMYTDLQNEDVCMYVMDVHVLLVCVKTNSRGIPI